MMALKIISSFQKATVEKEVSDFESTPDIIIKQRIPMVTFTREGMAYHVVHLYYSKVVA